MRALEFVARDPGADVLVVTNMWPEPDRPVHGIFIKRQVDSIRAAGIGCDVLYLRGYVSPLAYSVAALRLLISSIAWRHRYRLIHVHAGETALAARFHVGTPMLVSYCGDDVLGDPDERGRVHLRKRLRAAVVRAHSRLFPVVVTKSKEMAERLPERTRRRVTVLPNGVDANAFRPLDMAVARRQLGWAEDERVALFAATRPDSPRKRRWLAEGACEYARRIVGPFRFHVAGSSSPDEMPLLLNAADCLLHTSSIEGSPNIVKEALMCNLPVVATRSGDVAELLDGVVPSWVCEPDPEPLADALVECFTTRERSNGRSAAGHLAADRVAEQILDLYASLAPDSRANAVLSSAERRTTTGVP